MIYHNQIVDKDKPLTFGPSDHLELITTDSMSTERFDNREPCDLIFLNLSLCAFYTEKIMYYELAQFFTDDLIRTLYCRMGNEKMKVLPKRIFLNHHEAKYSIYIADPSTVKVG